MTAQDRSRWAEILSPDNVPVRPRRRRSDADAECDVFACLDCGSMLILESSAVDEPAWHRPTGEGCDTCTDLPCSRPAELPVAEPLAVVEADLQLPGTTQERENVTAELAAGLVKNSPVEVAADAYAKKAVELTCDMLERISPTESSSLDALATGLDKVSGTVASGIAWCATELVGMPEFLGKVLGHMVAELVTDPLQLKEVARAVRVVDMIACAVEGDLSSCESVRHLGKDLGQAELADLLKEAAKAAQELADAVEEPGPIERPDRWFQPEPSPEPDEPGCGGIFGF